MMYRKVGKREDSPFVVQYVQPYELMCRPDREWQRAKLESLRYRFCYTRAALARRTMQRLGDFARKHSAWWLTLRGLR